MKYLLTSDWHLRHTTPPCRTDDFQKAQWNKVEQVFKLAIRERAQIIHAGDLFIEHSSHYGPVNKLMSLIEKYNVIMKSIAGNHDLPNHNIKNIDKCAYGAMINSKLITHLTGIKSEPNNVVFQSSNWKEPLPEKIIEYKAGRAFNIMVLHYFVFPSDIPDHWQLSDAVTVNNLIKKYRDFDVILTGHNHVNFIRDINGSFNCKKPRQIVSTVLVNPGSLTRHKADQIDHEPSVYLLDTIERTIVNIPLDIEPDVISTEHIDIVTNQKLRIEKYIEALQNQQLEESLNIDFEDSIQKLIDLGDIDQLTKTYLEQSVFPERFTKEDQNELSSTTNETEKAIGE